MSKIKKLIYTYEKPNYKEEFKNITYPGIKLNKYMISNYGRVLNITNNKIMKTYFNSDNHEKITLVTNIKSEKKRGNKSKHYFIHRLMLWEFIGPPPDDNHNICNHKNGIPCCNLIDNLEWSSVLENTNHAKEHGLLNNSGINAKVCKYSEKMIRKICKLFEEGYNNIEIFELISGKKEYKKKGKYNGLYLLINKLGKRICYRDIVKDYIYLPKLSYFKCDKETALIRKYIKDGLTNIDIMKKINLDIKYNRTLYNRIISERVKCEVLFNDYQKLYNQIHRNM